MFALLKTFIMYILKIFLFGARARCHLSPTKGTFPFSRVLLD
jgi:hypothetical protein